MEEKEKIDEVESVKKKNNKGLVIVIILFIIIVLGLTSYICYDKGIIFNNNIEEEKKQVDKTEEAKIEEISINDERFIKIYESLKEYTYDENRINGDKDFNYDELGEIGVSTLTANDFIKTDELNEWQEPYYTFSSNTLLNNLKDLFGEDISFSFDSIIGRVYDNTAINPDGKCISIENYNSENNNYQIKFSLCSDSDTNVPIIIPRKIISAKKNDDTILVEEKAIYYYEEWGRYNIYKDKDLTELIDSKNFDTNNENIKNETISVSDYLDEASTITHTFKLNKDTNKYYFVSSVIK